MKSPIALMTVVVLAFTSFTVNALDTVLAAESTVISPAEQQLTDWIATQRDSMLLDLKKIVEINSGTLNVEGINRVKEILSRELSKLGFKSRSVPGGQVTNLTCKGGDIQFADHLVATLNTGNGRKLLLNGHLDTVFPKDNAFQSLVVEGDTLKGPGVSDMKGGLIAMVYALKALHNMNLLENVQLTVLLNSDEEMGSLGSRSLIEGLAEQHDLGLVFEGSKENDLIRHRKGLGQVRLKVTGRASHSGAAHEEGVSAIRELSHKIVEIEKLTDYDRQTTVNVGLVQGGEARNTIPPCAEAYIDLRYPNNDRGNHLVSEIKRIAAIKHTQNPLLGLSPETEIWVKLHRPAKNIHPETDAILAAVMGISAALGQPLGSRYSGGGTDGSIMQSVGLPTMDSLGPDGKGSHSPREESSISSLMVRTKMTAVLLSRLIGQDG